MGKRQMVTDAKDWACIERITGEWFFANGFWAESPNGEYEPIDVRSMIALLQIEYPRFDGLDDGSLAMVFGRIWSEDCPPPTPTEALQQWVSTAEGAFAQVKWRQQLQAEADRLASLGQLTPVFWHDDADTPDDSDFLPDWMCHP